MGRARIEYRYGSYGGVIEVEARDDDDTETLYSKARKAAGLNFLAMAYESYKVVWRDYD